VWERAAGNSVSSAESARETEFREVRSQTEFGNENLLAARGLALSTAKPRAAAVQPDKPHEHRGRQPNVQELGSDRTAGPRVGQFEADVGDMDRSIGAIALVRKRPEKRDAEAAVRQGIQDAMRSRNQE